MKFAPFPVAPARLFVAAFVAFASLHLLSQTAPAAQQSAQPHGKVIFSRSVDENGQTTSVTGPGVQPAAGQPVTAPVATDEERQAVTFTAMDLDLHLHPASQAIDVRAELTLRNDGKSPLAHIPLQISSSLAWDRIRLSNRDIAFTVATLNSDVDHTGQLHEAAIALETPLAPGASLSLDVSYSGVIPQSARRLLTIGTPDDVALHSDWDQIGVDFTGLRGFGNVVWYPVSSVPVILGDGARVFDEMGEHKLRLAGAHFRLRLTDEFPRGQAPTVALVNGHPILLTRTEPDATNPDLPGIATASVDTPALGFEAPSLFVAIRKPYLATNAALYVIPANSSAIEGWASAASYVTPFLQGWLGQSPRSQLTILDLPDSDDTPYETGALLVTAVRPAAPDRLDGILAHALTHAWMSSPRAWLSEGVAHFMGTLWIEKQAGRQKALESLESGRTALALSEPSSPGESSGQTLSQAISPVYYRTKAAYVFWMLRDLAGDPALSAALRAYMPGDDAAQGFGPTATPGVFQKLIEQAGMRTDLGWFFSDWVDKDKGLPDISIDGVFPSHTEGDNWLVSINLSNSGYASAEIPVTVSNAQTSVTQRVIVPARGKAVQRILIQGRPTQVQADDGTVPETEASVHILSLTDAGKNAPSVPNGTSSSSSQTEPVQQ